LFHDDWPAEPVFEQAPRAWITGDLHLENFGSYKGDNRLGYFDLNDFDEGTLAPCTRDLLRFLTSISVSTLSLGVKTRQADTLTRRFLDRYRAALATGKARWVERQTAEGMVGDLLANVRQLTRKRLLALRTELRGRRYRLRLGARALPVSRDERGEVARMLARFAEGEPDPDFYRLIDVARRVAGIASLGLRRYVLLVQGRGAPGKLVLLDLKQAISPSLAVPSGAGWTCEAERVVAVQHWGQAVPPALLHPLRDRRHSYVLRELQPTQNRLSLERWNGKLSRLEGVMSTMGELVGWSHLRSGGRGGAATTDQWIEFAADRRWVPAALQWARDYSRRVETDWKEFAETVI
jgi:uncharacterized protein (DUF2252 family)